MLFSGRDANWTLVAIGQSVAAIGLILGIGADNKAREAVNMYNSASDSSMWKGDPMRIRIGIMRSGVGALVAFLKCR